MRRAPKRRDPRPGQRKRPRPACRPGGVQVRGRQSSPPENSAWGLKTCLGP
ncbi:hypothetical protein AZA_67268 [Nitrospirillum viridazoti Y2]|nr:hypothetical protein AZA_67268 [Nitrospirillum amazonense Y2]